MSQVASTVHVGTVGPVRAIGSHAASGAFWTVFFSALNKCLAFASQIVLAHLLLPYEFGLVAMTLSVASFVAVMCGSTLLKVLTQRTDSFEQDAPHAFWLALVFNVVGAALLAVIAPVAGTLFKNSAVVPLILVFALAIPFQALPTVYAASLGRELRFRTIAIISFGAGIIQNVLSVTLAWLGFGAYSLVIPLVVMAVYMAIAYRVAAGRVRVGRPQFRQWGGLGKAAMWFMVVTGLTAFQTTGVSLVIGLVHDPKTTGYFYWGFTASSQVVSLLAVNLQYVMMAVLARLNSEGDRQAMAAEKVIRTLTLMVMPVCLLQALLAEPLIAFIFRDQWLPSVPVVEFISFGMVTQPLNLLAGSLLMARGKFRRLAGATAVMVALLMASAALGAALGDQREIARTVTAGMWAANLYSGWLVFREFGKGWPQLFTALLPALVLSIPLAGVTCAARHFSASLGTPLTTLITVGTCATTFAVLLKQFYPEVLREATARFSRSTLHEDRPSAQT